MTDYNDLPLEHPAGHSLPMSLLSDGVADRHGRRADDEEEPDARCGWCDRRWLGYRTGPCPQCREDEANEGADND